MQWYSDCPIGAYDTFKVSEGKYVKSRSLTKQFKVVFLDMVALSDLIQRNRLKTANLAASKQDPYHTAAAAAETAVREHVGKQQPLQQEHHRIATPCGEVHLALC